MFTLGTETFDETKQGSPPVPKGYYNAIIESVRLNEKQTTILFDAQLLDTQYGGKIVKNYMVNLPGTDSCKEQWQVDQATQKMNSIGQACGLAPGHVFNTIEDIANSTRHIPLVVLLDVKPESPNPKDPEKNFPARNEVKNFFPMGYQPEGQQTTPQPVQQQIQQQPAPQPQPQVATHQAPVQQQQPTPAQQELPPGMKWKTPGMPWLGFEPA